MELSSIMLPRGAETAFLGKVLWSKMGTILDPKTIKKSVQDQLETHTRKVRDYLYKLAPSGRSKTSKSTVRSSKIEVSRFIKTQAKLIKTMSQNRPKRDPQTSKKDPNIRHEKSMRKVTSKGGGAFPTLAGPGRQGGD